MLSCVKMAAQLLWSILYLSLIIQTNEAQECLQLPPFLSHKDKKITRHHQAIISSYKFDCNEMCGNITEWGVDVQPGGKKHNKGQYSLDLQVWRPSPTVDGSIGTGCYSLVGNNRFTSITFSSNLVRVTPSPQDYIQFQPGDVLGFYVEEALSASDGVVILTSPSSFTSELVWQASIVPTMATSQNGDCPYSVGSSGVLNTLTRAAPVISISTTTFSCPSLPSMATTQPTPPPNPTTDSEETPTTTTQEPVDPSEGTGTEVRVPTTQESVDPTTTTTTTTTTTGSTSGENDSQTTSESVTDSASTDSETENEIKESSTFMPAATEPRTPASSSPLGLAVGLILCIIMVVIIAITIAISVAVCWRTGKIRTLPFHLQINIAYRRRGNTTENVTAGVYSYPMVDMDTAETRSNDALIITKRNTAYSTTSNSGTEVYEEPIQCFDEDFCTTKVAMDIRSETCIPATPIEEPGNQASIEYCYIITTEKDDTSSLTENTAYESTSTTVNDS